MEQLALYCYGASMQNINAFAIYHPSPHLHAYVLTKSPDIQPILIRSVRHRATGMHKSKESKAGAIALRH